MSYEKQKLMQIYKANKDNENKSIDAIYNTLEEISTQKDNPILIFGFLSYYVEIKKTKTKLWETKTNVMGITVEKTRNIPTHEIAAIVLEHLQDIEYYYETKQIPPDKPQQYADVVLDNDYIFSRTKGVITKKHTNDQDNYYHAKFNVQNRTWHIYENKRKIKETKGTMTEIARYLKQKNAQINQTQKKAEGELV